MDRDEINASLKKDLEDALESHEDFIQEKNNLKDLEKLIESRGAIKLLKEDALGMLPEEDSQLKPSYGDPKTRQDIAAVAVSLRNFLWEKNARYGNAALEPLGVFSKLDAQNSIFIRLDDKLQRIKNSDTLRKNDVVDAMGYLALLCIHNKWTDFDDLID